MNKLLSHLKPYWKELIVMFLFTYAQVMASLALPDYTAKIIGEGVMLENQDVILSAGGEMIVITLIGAVCTIAVGYYAAKIGTGFAQSIRSAVFKKVESYSLQEFTHFSTASLITRTTNDIQQIQTVIILIFRMVISAPITGIGAVIKANNSAPDMTWIMGVGVAFLFTVITVIFVFAVPKFTLLQKLVDKLNLVTRENLKGLRVIRAFTSSKYEEKKFDKVNLELTKTTLFVNRMMVVMQPIMMFIFNIVVILTVWVGASLIGDKIIGVGDMMAFMQYAVQVIMAFLMFSMVFIMVPRAAVSAKRVSEILNTDPSILDPESSLDSKISKGVVEFKNVSFSYPNSDEPVIKDISFFAKPGQVTAVIGGTGSGKSTLINLVPRFFDVTSGSILIDGVNIKDYRQEYLRSKIGYVPQKGLLFSGTIKENIAFGKRDALVQEISKAAEIAQAKEFIDKFPAGLNNDISQGGKNVSGGQKQRLAIARALLIDPLIYVFDDSFSALDFKTDLQLRTALKPRISKATVFIVTQRVGTILDADQIIVLEKGEIVGIGTHKELLKSCTVYREIAEAQLSKKELMS